jgi:hypothetical protein
MSIQAKIEILCMDLRIEKGILHCVYSENLHLNLEMAVQCVKERIEFSKGISYPCLIDIGGIKAVDSEARAYMATEGAKLVKAAALLTNSIYTKILGNIFLTINKPEIPVRLFSDKAAAIKWLKQYL